ERARGGRVLRSHSQAGPQNPGRAQTGLELVHRRLDMQREFKTISKNSISEALAKVQHYRYLNQAEEAESICRDILAVDLENQMALRLLGLAITDQFTGAIADRHAEAQGCFEKLLSGYERAYYLGIVHE